MKQLERYIVVPNTKAGAGSDNLLDLMDLAEKRPDISIDQVVGDPKNPKRILIQAEMDAVKFLQGHFGDKLFIEPDRGLELYK
jgi:hypothetical protein